MEATLEASDCELQLPPPQLASNWITELPYKPKVAFLTAPTEVDLCITRRCNMSCVHCNVSAHSLEAREIIQVGKWKSILNELEEMGVFRVIISGGEPFAYDGFEELFEHLLEKKYLKIILTNGLLVTEEQIKQMKENNIALNISLDGIGSTHDEFRKSNGSYMRILNLLPALSGRSLIYTIQTTVHKKNIHQLEDITRLAYEYKATKLIFRNIEMVGRGTFARDYLLTREDELTIKQIVTDMSKKYPQLDILGGYSQSGPMANENRVDATYGMVSCMAGTFGMAIDHDGKVFSCVAARNWRVNPIGSILEDSVENIWRSPRWTFYRDTERYGCRAEDLHKGKAKTSLPMIY